MTSETLPDAPTLLRPAEAQKMLSVSRTWLYQAARDGIIPSLRLGGPNGPLRFERSEVLAFIERSRERRSED